MVSLEKLPSTPQQSDPYAKYSNAVVTNGVSPISVTMKPEDDNPKAMSVQERIRALNKSANDASKPTFRGPAVKRSVSPWQAKATKPEAKVPLKSTSVNAVANGNDDDQQQVKPAEPTRSVAPQIPDDEDVVDDNEAANLQDNATQETTISNSGEAETDKVATEQQHAGSNTLKQFMLESAPRDVTQLFDESEEETEGDFDASAAVKYWRRSKGEPEEECLVKNEQASDETSDTKKDDVQVQDPSFEKSNTLSTCDETNEDLPPQSELNNVEINSNPEHTVSLETDGHTDETEPPADEQEEMDSVSAGSKGRAQEPHAEDQAPSPPGPATAKPPSPPVITRTVHSYPDMDAIEQTNDIAADNKETSEEQEDNVEEKPGRGKPCEEKPEKEKPTAARSFSQRAFEKRSSRRRAVHQNAQAPTSPRGKDRTNTKDTDTGAEVESASVLSGSTVHSASTIHTTTLSSRATRLLKEKRQGNVTKADGLATSLAKNLLRAKSPTASKPGITVESSCGRDESDVKYEAQSSIASSQNLTPKIDDISSKFADNSNYTPEQVDSMQQSPTVAQMSTPSGMGDQRYSNPNLNHPMAYQMQRQPSHISQYSNPIQFGPSPSFQNVEVGITTGPTLYQKQHSVPHYINPAAGMPQFGSYPNNADPRYTPNRAAPIPNDLLVQPKFSRYNSFDVQNPKPPPIQNMLTEDSASWCESRTQDTQDDGTLDEDGSATFRTSTPVESVGQDSHDQDSIGQDSNSAHPSIERESMSRLDSFPKGRSFDKECTVFEHIQNACNALSPKSCSESCKPEIISNPTIQSNDLIHVRNTFSNTLSEEDVAIEVEYVAGSTEQEDIDGDIHEDDFDTYTSESGSIYSLSTRDMDSKGSFSVDNV